MFGGIVVTSESAWHFCDGCHWQAYSASVSSDWLKTFTMRQIVTTTIDVASPTHDYRSVGYLHARPDTDRLLDLSDNCTLVKNAAQRDTDHDGLCDFLDVDLNNDSSCLVNTLDFGLFKRIFGHQERPSRIQVCL